MPLRQTLIDSAVKKCSSDADLARRLGVSKGLLSMVRSGKAPMSPEMAALLADIAGEDARQAVVDAVIERAEGSPRGLVLREILGKARATGAAAMLAFSYSVPATYAIGKIADGLYIVSSWRFRGERRRSPRSLSSEQPSAMRLSYRPDGTPAIKRMVVQRT